MRKEGLKRAITHPMHASTLRAGLSRNLIFRFRILPFGVALCRLSAILLSSVALLSGSFWRLLALRRLLSSSLVSRSCVSFFIRRSCFTSFNQRFMIAVNCLKVRSLTGVSWYFTRWIFSPVLLTICSYRKSRTWFSGKSSVILS